MTNFTNDLTLTLSIGIVILNIVTVFFIFLILNLVFSGNKNFGGDKNKKNYAGQENKPSQTIPAAMFISKWGLVAGFIVSVAAILGSLTYSNVIGFAPCELCWWIRVLLYPQAIIFAVGLWRKPLESAIKSAGHASIMAEIKALTYDTALILSVLGALVSGYQYYGEMFDQNVLSLCNANGVSCAKTYFQSFGYITIPFMALSTFLFLIGIIVVEKLARQ
jgi:disulfide bond formation protein DsbB